MSVTEILLRLLAQLRPMLPGAIALVAATLIVLPVLSVWGRRAWLKDRRFRLAGLFFGLDGRGTARLACSWMKVVFMVTFVLAFQKLALVNYLMLLIPGLVTALAGGSLVSRGGDVLWLILQTVGLLSTNLICGYIRDMDGGPGFIVLYAAMGLFLILFSIYLFLNELSGISAQRDVEAETIWSRETDSEE